MDREKLLVIFLVSFVMALGAGAGCGKSGKEQETAEVPADTQAQGEAMPEGVEPEGEEAPEEDILEVPEGTGTFYVTSNPVGARIYVNDQSVDKRTPHLFSAEPGDYKVTVELSGFTPVPGMMEIEVKEESVDTLRFDLDGEPMASYAIISMADKEVWPKWSPDGKTIVYEAYYGGNRDIYTIPALGGTPTRITFHERADFSPCWAPNSREIVFSSNRDGTVDLYIVDATGEEEPRVLAHGEGAEDNAAFSPDGRWIAFESLSKIWKMPANGGKMEQVTTGAERHFYPSWSPDGKEIAYTVQIGDSRRIWAVSVQTGAVREIVADEGWSYNPAWSPNGRVIAFARRGGPPDRNHDLWICAAEGGELTQITTKAGLDQHPSWSPDGHSLVWTKNADLWIMTNLPGWLTGEVEAPETEG